jgi:flagellar biosynthesis/type III secretory pathway protein FliH
MKATSVNANKKLRRDRQFSEDSPIQSQIPSDLAPFSRRFRPKSAPRWPTVGVLSEAALDDPEQAINRTICGDAVRVLRKLPRN